MNKIVKLLALALVVMLTLAGCKTVEVEKPVDTTTVVAEYKGGTVLKGEALDLYKKVENNYIAEGFASHLDNPETVKNIKADLLDAMVNDKIITEKAKELGVSEIPDDKRVEALKQAATDYESMIMWYQGSFATEEMTNEEAREATIKGLSEVGITEDAVKVDSLETLKEQMLYDKVTEGVELTDDDIKVIYDERVAADKETFTNDPGAYDNADNPMWAPEGVRTVKHILIKGDAAIDKELSDLNNKLADIEFAIEDKEPGYLDELMANEEGDDDLAAIEEAYANAPTVESDETATDDEDEEGEELPAEGEEEEMQTAVGGASMDNTGDEPVITEAEPIVIDTESATDAASDAVDTASEPETEAVDAAAEAVTAEPETTEPEIQVEAGEGLSVEVMPTDEEPAADEPDYAAMTVEELKAMREEVLKQIEETEKKLSASVEPILAEVKAKIDAGEDFDALIEEYGQDQGMRNEPTKSTGYTVSASSSVWDPAFKEGAMALENVGDISGPVYGQSGCHIIRYNGDVPSGPINFDFVKESLKDEALQQKKDEVFATTTDQWITDAEIKTYPERL